MENKAEKVVELVKHCLFREEEIKGMKEPPENAVIGEGVIGKMAFHPERLEEKRGDVRKILEDMHHGFMADGGGGWTFLNLPFDKHETQWCEQPTASDLCAIGNAMGMVKYMFPRDDWKMFPGGVPYLSIHLDGSRSAS